MRHGNRPRDYPDFKHVAPALGTAKHGADYATVLKLPTLFGIDAKVHIAYPPGYRREADCANVLLNA